MQSITSLVDKLSTDYPNFHFRHDTSFRWDPPSKTIFYDTTSQDTASLLHELAHAVLGHNSYLRDIELIEMERDAWNYALTLLAAKYSVVIPSNAAEDALDTYRDWLHARSACPVCAATGIQTRKDTYKCLACRSRWKVNEARVCALRRYVINEKHTQ